MKNVGERVVYIKCTSTYTYIHTYTSSGVHVVGRTQWIFTNFDHSVTCIDGKVVDFVLVVSNHYTFWQDLLS